MFPQFLSVPFSILFHSWFLFIFRFIQVKTLKILSHIFRMSSIIFPSLPLFLSLHTLLSLSLIVNYYFLLWVLRASRNDLNLIFVFSSNKIVISKYEINNFFSIFSLQIERELILSTDKGGSKVPIKQYPRQIPTTPVAFNRSSISNGNGSTGGVIQQFLPKSSTAVAPDHPTTKHAWVSFSS